MRIARTTTLVTAATADQVGFGQAEIMQFVGEKAGFANFDGKFRPSGEFVQVINPWLNSLPESTTIAIDPVPDAFDVYMVVSSDCE